MPKFLAGCHNDEEEISPALERKYRILAGPNEWQKVCNRSNPEKTRRSCEGADFSWFSSKVSRTLAGRGGERDKEFRLHHHHHFFFNRHVVKLLLLLLLLHAFKDLPQLLVCPEKGPQLCMPPRLSTRQECFASNPDPGSSKECVGGSLPLAIARP
jgi:hypothetical protein